MNEKSPKTSRECPIQNPRKLTLRSWQNISTITRIFRMFVDFEMHKYILGILFQYFDLKPVFLMSPSPPIKFKANKYVKAYNNG